MKQEISDNSYSNYTKVCLYVTLSVLLIVASFNLIIDPQKIFRVVDIQGVNHEKPFMDKIES